MEGDDSNNDYFSSFNIDQSSSQNDNYFDQEILPSKKLKVRRSTKKIVLDDSRYFHLYKQIQNDNYSDQEIFNTVVLPEKKLNQTNYA
jgi:hypothetical protein